MPSGSCPRGHEYPEEPEFIDGWAICPECDLENRLIIRTHHELMKLRLNRGVEQW